MGMTMRAARPITAEKMTARLLLLRKGADASVSLAQLFQVLDHLGGWTVTPIVAEIAYPNNPTICGEGDEASARAKYDALKAIEVEGAPAAPQDGVEYARNVGEYRTWRRGGESGPTFWGCDYSRFITRAGYRFTSPEGETHDLVPGWYTRVLTASDAFRLLKEKTSYLAQVSLKLGMEPHEPAEPRTQENTGSCPVCFGNFKLHTSGARTMVLHGFTRPRYEHCTVGRCSGVGHEPWELSPKGTAEYRDALAQIIPRQEAYLAALTEGTVESISDGRKTYQRTTTDHGHWVALVDGTLRATQRLIKELVEDVKLLSFMIDTWKPEALPAPGLRVRNWMLEATLRMRKVSTEAAA